MEIEWQFWTCFHRQHFSSSCVFGSGLFVTDSFEESRALHRKSRKRGTLISFFKYIIKISRPLKIMAHYSHPSCTNVCDKAVWVGSVDWFYWFLFPRIGARYNGICDVCFWCVADLRWLLWIFSSFSGLCPPFANRRSSFGDLGLPSVAMSWAEINTFLRWGDTCWWNSH